MTSSTYTHSGLQHGFSFNQLGNIPASAEIFSMWFNPDCQPDYQTRLALAVSFDESKIS